jgi:hypothetical protein
VKCSQCVAIAVDVQILRMLHNVTKYVPCLLLLLIMESKFSCLETTEQQSITSFPLCAYFKASYNFVSNTHPLILAFVLEEDMEENR